MDKKSFKRIINDCLLSNSFFKKGKFYYKNGSDIICVLGIQKSNYENCYYVNVGLVIKELNPEITHPQETDGDIRYRFYFEFDGKETDCIKIENISDGGYLSSVFEKKITEFINPALHLDGLKRLLANQPVLLYQTTLNAKKYLDIKT